MRQELAAEKAKAAAQLQEEAGRAAKLVQEKEGEYKREIARLRSSSAQELNEKMTELATTREATFARARRPPLPSPPVLAFPRSDSVPRSGSLGRPALRTRAGPFSHLLHILPLTRS